MLTTGCAIAGGRSTRRPTVTNERPPPPHALCLRAAADHAEFPLTATRAFGRALCRCSCRTGLFLRYFRHIFAHGREANEMSSSATILHADLDAFYASVEQLLDP